MHEIAVLSALRDATKLQLTAADEKTARTTLCRQSPQRLRTDYGPSEKNITRWFICIP